MKTTRLIIVGGFLGAGKTTLLWESAQKIMQKGKRIGLITNDQAPELVDTAILSSTELTVSEVSGSCFCCNFNGLIQAMKQLRSEANADVIIAEPVGSCTDLSATIMQPLKEQLKGDLLISPLSVLADPEKLIDILNGNTAGLHASAAYIFRKQLEESDIILISKSDLLSGNELYQLKERVKSTFPQSEVMCISSKNGEGVEEWLTEVLSRTDAGKHLVQVDYDVYAEGEAVLGWLNTTIELTANSADWDLFVKNLMTDLSNQFDSMKASVGHLKIILKSENQSVIGNITGSQSTLSLRGLAGIGNKATLTLNARVEMSPEMLEEIIRKSIEQNLKGDIKAEIIALKSLSPGRPNPTYRFEHVIS